MIDEKKLKKNSEKKIDKKVLIGIIIAIVLVIAILIIIFLPKKNNKVGEIILADNIKSIYVSEKKEIVAEVRNYSDAIINYQSSDESVLKFDKNVMEGISVGNSKITISCNIDGVKPLTFDVTVIDGGGIINQANFPNGELVIGVNKEYDLDKEIILNPANGKANSKIFTSSNVDIATVDGLGILKSLKKGMTNIRVNINNSLYSTISVFVIDKDVSGEIIKNVDKIIFKEDTIKINIGDTKKIEYDVYPVDSSMKYVTASCSDSKIVSLDNDGNIKGLKEGKANILYKTIDNKEYKLNVEVVNGTIDVVDIKVMEENISLEENSSKEVNINVVPTTATNKELKVKSTDVNIAEVSIKDDTLIINGKSVGETSVIIESNNGIKKTIMIKVLKKNINTPTPVVTVTPLPIPERKIEESDYDNRGYSISTTTGNLNRTYDISIKDEIAKDSSVITFKSKKDNLNIWVCDYLYGDDKCDINNGVHLIESLSTYEIKGYGMHVISVYEDGKVLIPYYIYLVKPGYDVTNLYVNKDEAKDNSVKAKAEVSFNITSDKTSKLKVCWVSSFEDCDPLTEVNTVKPITKINNKLYLNNANLWKVKIIELDSSGNTLRGPDIYYINVVD